jgi:hypothetical protein
MRGSLRIARGAITSIVWLVVFFRYGSTAASTSSATS